MRPQANQEISGPATAFPAAAGATIENATGTERKPMKITVERGAFLKALSHVQSVVERRNTIPILSNVMIDAAKGQLKLTATDLDIEMVESLPADVLRNGSATAPAHMLYDIVRKLPEGAQVQAELLSSEGGRLAVSAGTVRFELACLPKEDFPQMSAGALPHRFRLAADDLKRVIDKTRFAISTEETRYYLNGIYLHAYQEGKKTAMTITWKYAAGDESVNGFKEGFEKGGGKVTKQLTVPFPNVEFQALLTEIAAAKPDAVPMDEPMHRRMSPVAVGGYSTSE